MKNDICLKYIEISKIVKEDIVKYLNSKKIN